MAHIAPRPPAAHSSASTSQSHFAALLVQVEQLYVTYRRHFPPESTAWGFYLDGFEDVTDDLKAIATRRLTELGLSNQHTFYNLFVGPNRRDEVCACVQIMGPGLTRFYFEQRLIEEMKLPRPLPDRHVSQKTDRLSQRIFCCGPMGLADLSRCSTASKWRPTLPSSSASTICIVPVLKAKAYGSGSTSMTGFGSDEKLPALSWNQPQTTARGTHGSVNTSDNCLGRIFPIPTACARLYCDRSCYRMRPQGVQHVSPKVLLMH